MRTILIQNCDVELEDDVFNTLFDRHAIVGTEVGYTLNEDHAFTAGEVRLLMGMQEDER